MEADSFSFLNTLIIFNQRKMLTCAYLLPLSPFLPPPAAASTAVITITAFTQPRKDLVSVSGSQAWALLSQEDMWQYLQALGETHKGRSATNRSRSGIFRFN